MRLSKLLNKPESPRYFAPDARFVLPECRIGLEFEFEHTGNVARERRLPITPWSHYWEWHEEGSIRDGGSEFVFVEPLYGRDIVAATQGLCQYAHDHDWRSTIRTGLHVHMDVRDLEVMQFVGLCVLYAIFEPAIYHWIGDNRDNSHFCIPWYKAEGSTMEAAGIIRSALKPVDGANREMLVRAEGYQRYAAFNLNALFRFGSVEARHMKCTTDSGRVFKWINLLMALKRATTRIPQSDVAVVRMVENLGAANAIENLLGPEFLFLNYKDLQTDTTELGITTANELIREGLTVNLWEQANTPKGENVGFKQFMDGYKPGNGEFPPADVERVNLDDYNVEPQIDLALAQMTPQGRAPRLFWQIAPALEAVERAGQLPRVRNNGRNNRPRR